MGRHSIKFKFTLLLTFLVAGLIVAVLVINSTLAEKYYLSDKRDWMINEYNYINGIMTRLRAEAVDMEQLDDIIEQDITETGVSVLVVDSDWSTVYTNINGVADMVDRLRLSMFNGEMFDDINPSHTTPQHPDKDLHEKPSKGPTFDISNMTGMNQRDVIIQENNYTLQKIYDSKLLGDYYELWGTLDSGDFIMIRMSVQGIRDNVSISNKFITYVGLIVLIAGIVASLVLTNYFVNPIKALSHIASRMAVMDFNARYEGSDKSEIGVLGNSMNYMSESLEENIAKLKSANIQLQRDVEKREQLDKMRSDFISNVSHELKTPIALIQGYAEGLRDGITDDPESMAYYCDVIVDEAAKMNMMVKKLMTLNQIEFGNEELVMERFDIVDMISSCISSNEVRFAQKGIRVEFEHESEVMDVWSDEYKVEEVITNYISNAINHCANEMLIKVSAVYKDDSVRVYVYNTGEHIPVEDIDKIWTKFYKVDKARTREYGGNGIGLSIVKAIMDSYGKQCGVENVDGGVSFWFDLDANA